jgi:DNA-directed RNA polymerase specialized sigma24 family protein
MSSEGSVTRWVAALKGGTAAAAQPLWERYHRRLVFLARQKLRCGRCPAAADEEDVIQNAFHRFFRGVSAGRFPQLADREDLWRLLVVITARKALNQLARERSKRRGGGTVQGESGISPLPLVVARFHETTSSVRGRMKTPSLRARRPTAGALPGRRGLAWR